MYSGTGGAVGTLGTGGAVGTQGTGGAVGTLRTGGAVDTLRPGGDWWGWYFTNRWGRGYLRKRSGGRGYFLNRF